MSYSIDHIQDRRLARLCCYGACPEPAHGDGDYCEVHDAHERGRARTKAKRRRQRLADAGRCIVPGCGAKVGKQRVGGRVVQRRCPGCMGADRKAKADRRRVPGKESRVPGNGEIPPAARRGHTKQETYSDGSTRTRYVGRATRGGPSKEDRARDVLKDAADAVRWLQAFLARYPDEWPRVDDLPRIQRDEARALLAEPLVRGLRMAAGVVVEVAPATWKGMCPCCGQATSDDDAG